MASLFIFFKWNVIADQMHLSKHGQITGKRLCLAAQLWQRNISYHNGFCAESSHSCRIFSLLLFLYDHLQWNPIKMITTEMTLGFIVWRWGGGEGDVGKWDVRIYRHKAKSGVVDNYSLHWGLHSQRTVQQDVLQHARSRRDPNTSRNRLERLSVLAWLSSVRD